MKRLRKSLISWSVGVVLLVALPGPSHGGEFPWKAGDVPPEVAGVRLGDGLVRLEKVLGPPSRSEKLGDNAQVFTYRQRGLEVIYASLDGAAIIYLLSRAAGDLDGVRLGDKREDVLARWGEPHSVAGPMAIYRAGIWGVFVKVGNDDRIKQLGLGRMVDQVPENAKFYRKQE